MDKVILLDAIRKLNSLPQSRIAAHYAYEQAVRQFNTLLVEAQYHYPERVDIQVLEEYTDTSNVITNEFSDRVRRLKEAIELRPLDSSAETFAQIKLPEDTPSDVKLDMNELEGALNLNLHKAALLLSGSIAEALLLIRHPDKSEKGPGLSGLIEQASKERLFGRDTLSYLENLKYYRDLIHPRAEKRNKTPRNEERVSVAIDALKLLCKEFQDQEVRFENN